MNHPRRFVLWLLFLAPAWSARCQEPPTVPPATGETVISPRDILPPYDWETIDLSVDRALDWLAVRQQADGRFPTIDQGQPGVTCLCVLAFLSRGHVPGEGPYGDQLTRAVRFIAGCQLDDGIITYVPPTMGMGAGNPVHAASYNHPIAGLTLSEVYGMIPGEEAGNVRRVVERAIEYTRKQQTRTKRSPADLGGWRYIKPWPGSDSDLSLTSWHLLFLRSAKNAGFDVPSQYVDEAMEYVKRLYDPETGAFLYGLADQDRHSSTTMAAAGILSLSLGGFHDTEMARTAGDFILRNPFEPYLRARGDHEGMYFYAAFYCSQAMHQLGGRRWKEFYVHIARVLVANQTPEGCWHPETSGTAMYGNVYTTALAVLARTTPDQLLPIYQR